MNQCIIFIVSIYFCIFSCLFAPTAFIGNANPGFSFSILPEIKIDYFNQFIYICSAEQILQNNSALSFSISVCDLKNNSSAAPYRFLPIITKNAIINNIIETNPLYGNGFKNFGLLLGLEFEPKFYPIINPIDSSQIYILNNLELYNNESNKLITTEPLLDSNSEEGHVVVLAPLQNKFVAGVMEKNSIFGENNNFCKFYQYIVKEKILQIPGVSHYVSSIQLEAPTSFLFSNETVSLCVTGESEVNLLPGYLTVHPNISLNKTYIGVSGNGITGIKAISVYDEPILPISSEAALNGNNIVATNEANTNIYINKISSLFTTTGLSYLTVLGGTNDENESQSVVYALPLINNPTNTNLIGTLASINQIPTPLFDINKPHYFLGNLLSDSPNNPGDLFTTASYGALVGNMPLIINKNGIIYQLKINSMEGYKDTVFISTSYLKNDKNGVGGLFYSQALFDQFGMIQAWTQWQRKNIYGNCQTQAYIPTIGSNIGIYANINNQIIMNQFSPAGPFLSGTSGGYKSLDCFGSGIEKIIDIPYTHPGIGVNMNSILGLKPSYLIAVGYNTVILQQTAKNNILLPIIYGTSIHCINGNAGGILDKNENTNIVSFQGGALENAGALFTAALGYSDIDCWIVAAGANGIYILANPDGTGCGVNFLQDNFIGIHPTLVWRKIGDFKCIKKIVSNKDFLYVVSNNKIYRIPLYSENIIRGENCQYQVLLQNTDLPESTEYTSFSDGLFCNHTCLLATSVGLFTNNSKFSIESVQKISVEKIILPESFGVMPISLYPVTIDGNLDSWLTPNNTTIASNIYVMATSLSQHYSKVYRLVCYPNYNNSGQNYIALLPNYFIKDFPTYYYNPNIELLSIATDGASIFSHGVYGNSTLYRSYIGILNPFIRHGNLALKNEYNFFELASKTNSYFGYPTYISGIGLWLFSGQQGIQGLC